MKGPWGGRRWCTVFVGLIVFLAAVGTTAASEFLPRYLAMLGYSPAEIQQLLSGEARLSILDQVYQLEAMGYRPGEIEAILEKGVTRREVDGRYMGATLAEDDVRTPAGSTNGGDPMVPDDQPDQLATHPPAHDQPQYQIDSLTGHQGNPRPAGQGGYAPELGVESDMRPLNPLGPEWQIRGELTRVRPYLGAVRTTAQRFAVDPALILAVIAAESDFRPRAVSSKGAIGLMQLMPHTGAQFGASLRDLFEPGTNIVTGTRYLLDCLQRFGDERLALAAYNAGPRRVSRYQGVPPIDETQRYVAKVMGLRQRYRTLLGQDLVEGF